MAEEKRNEGQQREPRDLRRGPADWPANTRASRGGIPTRNSARRVRSRSNPTTAGETTITGLGILATTAEDASSAQSREEELPPDSGE